MTINGPRLVDSLVAKAFLADLTARPRYVGESIDRALDELAELPVKEGWFPKDEEQTEYVVAVYVRGTLAAGLLYGECRGHHIFYTPPEPVATYGQVSIGVLLRAHDALVAAASVYGVLVADGYKGFHDGHLDGLTVLTDSLRNVASERLRAEREGDK